MQTENRKNIRELITPEGVNLGVKLADIGSRIAAFLIDIMLMVAALIVISISLALLLGSLGNLAAIIWLLFFFFLRNFYFIFFEMGPKAATPGKRICKIRVAARDKPKLTANAVFARNALREIEFFLPLSFLGANLDSVDGWIMTAGLIWGLIFLFFPFFNRDHLRAGDLIAGTWVVQAPRHILTKDLTDETLSEVKSHFIFTPEQTQIYGIHELHVLEDVIRKNNETVHSDVAEKIREKIKWQKSIGEKDLDFLKAYYAALRRKLENQLLFGVRKKDKNHR